MPSGFIVERNGGRLCILLRINMLGIEELLDRFPIRKSLHTEFGDKATGKCVEVLISFLGTMPYIPLMEVATAWICCLGLAVRRSKMIISVWEEI